MGADSRLEQGSRSSRDVELVERPPAGDAASVAVTPDPDVDVATTPCVWYRTSPTSKVEKLPGMLTGVHKIIWMIIVWYLRIVSWALPALWFVLNNPCSGS